MLGTVPSQEEELGVHSCLLADLGDSCLIQSQLPASSVPDADSSSPGVAKPTCEVPRIPTVWLFLFLSNARLA